MKFHVLGANKETGDDIEVDLVAADTKQAEDLAHDRGILVASLKPIDDSIALDSIELEPESNSSSTTAAHKNPDAHAPAAASAHPPAAADGHAPHPDAHHVDNTPHPSTHLEYKIMTNQALFLMEKAVNKMILDGWEPVGGLTTAFQNNATSYFQAIIRRPKPS